MSMQKILTRFAAVAAALAVLSTNPLAAATDSDTPPSATGQDTETAVFAGGCFWCVESDFDYVPGVIRTISGYTGGRLDNPTYEQVSRNTTGHREAVEIVFDPQKVSYEMLLEVFWRSVDPTDGGGQFCDRGESYRTAIFYRNEAQQRLALASRQRLEESGQLVEAVATTLEPASTFYAAEDYHQDYYRKNPLRYQFYRYSCGRDERIKELWGEQAHQGIHKGK